MFGDFIDFIGGGLMSLLSSIFGLLPTMDMPDLGAYLSGSAIGQYLGYLNWFFPVGLALGITAAWAACIIAYNAYLAFSSWIKGMTK